MALIYGFKFVSVLNVWRHYWYWLLYKIALYLLLPSYHKFEVFQIELKQISDFILLKNVIRMSYYKSVFGNHIFIKISFFFFSFTNTKYCMLSNSCLSWQCYPYHMKQFCFLHHIEEWTAVTLHLSRTIIYGAC